MNDDLISRKALIAEYDRVHIGPPGVARKLMEDAPAVDAVPVVRCKECKNFTLVIGKGDRKIYGCKYMGRSVGTDFFCSYGERRATNDGENENE